MKIIIYLALFAAALHVSAESKVQYSFDVFTGYAAGHTTYVLDEKQVKSELVFPLDTFIYGGTAAVSYLENSRKLWSVKLSASGNITDPSNPMIDTDWIRIEEYPDIVFSYTESPAELSMVNLGIQADRLVFSGRYLSGYALAGYEYQKIKQDITGYTGWQYGVFSEDLVLWLIPETTINALYYEITYHKPSIGFITVWQPSDRLEVMLETTVMAVYLKDLDDHILRNKLSTASGWGFGGKGGIDLDFKLSENTSSMPRIGIAAGAEYIKAYTRQKQEWYDDEVSGGEVYIEKGRVYNNLSHIVSSLQLKIMLKAGVSF